MNVRDEHVLRELNLYPLWVRRGVPVAEEAEHPEQSPDLQSELPAELSSRTDAIPTQPARTMQEVELAPRPQPTGSLPAGPVEILPATDWATLKQQVHDCTACKLRAGCTQTVFGVGDEQADWLFVGEGPGAEEDARGEPFVGQSGKLLDNMLSSIGLKRGENVYIANVVKCQPPNDRNPEADEIATCMPYLRQQIALIKPKLIVALGKTAATALLGHDAPLGSLRGTTHDFYGTPLIITYHPAYLLRSPGEKARAWQDLKSAISLMN